MANILWQYNYLLTEAFFLLSVPEKGKYKSQGNNGTMIHSVRTKDGNKKFQAKSVKLYATIKSNAYIRSILTVY